MVARNRPTVTSLEPMRSTLILRLSSLVTMDALSVKGTSCPKSCTDVFDRRLCLARSSFPARSLAQIVGSVW